MCVKYMDEESEIPSPTSEGGQIHLNPSAI